MISESCSHRKTNKQTEEICIKLLRYKKIESIQEQSQLKKTKTDVYNETIKE